MTTATATTLEKYGAPAMVEQQVPGEVDPGEAYARLVDHVVVESEPQLSLQHGIGGLELAHRHGALLMLDEAHSIGSIGATGRDGREAPAIPQEATLELLGKGRNHHAGR